MNLVSIVIPCYNCAEFVHNTIESALDQTWSQCEIICVDNNSTDQTARVLEEFKRKYSNIIVGFEKKKGANAARNYGLTLAKGDYVQFLDADDIMVHNKVEHQMNLVQQFKPDVVISETIIRESDSEMIQKTTDDVWYGLFSTRLGYTSSNLWNKNKVLTSGGWREDLRSSQEYDLMFRLLKNGAVFHVDHSALTIMRKINSNSISSINIRENLIRYIDLRIEMLNFLIKNNYFIDHDIQPYKQQLFDKIRTLYPIDRETSLTYFDEIIGDDFTPISSESTTKKYLFLYKLVGFAKLESIRMKIADFLKN